MTTLGTHAVYVRLGAATVLRSVDFSVASGEIVGLIGPNGAGKTTLLRTLAGLVEPEAGDILLNGHPLRQMDRHARARTIAYLAQDAESHWPLAVETLVMMGRFPHMGPWRGPSAADRGAVVAALAACDVSHLAARPVDSLSGGEWSRVLLARALAVEPQILLADEPVAGLDPAHALDVMEMLRALANGGAGIVVVAHDLTIAARHCDRLVLLHGGRVAGQGRPAKVLSDKNLAQYYGIRAHHGTAADGKPVVIPIARSRCEERS